MPKKFTERIASTLHSHGLGSSDPFLLAFSGGRDSVALTESLLAEGFERLTLVHLDHCMREDSATDARWVSEFAAKRKLELMLETIDVPAEARSSGWGLEEAARNARYRWFTQVAKQRNCETLLLAHHADDQIETFLFRLMRGASSAGLSAMAVSSVRSEGDFHLRLVRPMLDVWRSEVNAYISSLGIEFLDDPSNATADYTRNRIRHELLPEMERIMKKPVRQALWRATELLRSDAEFLNGVECELGAVGDDLEVSFLRDLPTALRRRRIARWLNSHSVPNIGFELVESVSRLVLRISPAKVNLPGGGFARRRAGRIFIENTEG